MRGAKVNHAKTQARHNSRLSEIEVSNSNNQQAVRQLHNDQMRVTSVPHNSAKMVIFSGTFIFELLIK